VETGLSIKKSTKLLIQIINYLLGFILAGIFYALYSYFFDLIFFQIDYGSAKDYRASPFHYLVFFFVGYIFLALPGFVIYNFIMAQFIDKKMQRIIIGFTLGLLIGLVINRGGYSYYIGHLRGIKTGLTFATTLLSFELARGFFSGKNKD